MRAPGARQRPTGFHWKPGMGKHRTGRGGVLPPNNAVPVIGRVLVESDSDVSTAYGLAKQIQLMPLSHQC